MNILIVGENTNLEECQYKFGSQHQYSLFASAIPAEKINEKDSVVFDFTIHKSPNRIVHYADLNLPVFLNTVTITLAELAFGKPDPSNSHLFGFNGLPTFLSRELMEVTVLNPEKSYLLNGVCEQLKTSFKVVDDRVGMVSPRIICMIINEAFFTCEEGTASRKDIDLAMKLGTNYPYGPFEWCAKIGIKHVYEVLTAIYDDTKDVRYKVSPLLKKEYLKN